MQSLFSDLLLPELILDPLWKTRQVLVVGVLLSALVTRVMWKTLQRVSFTSAAAHRSSCQKPMTNWRPFVSSADIISTVEFDSTGNYLATGDKGGRVVLFERNEMVGLSVVHR